MCSQTLGLQAALDECQLREKQLTHKLEVQAEALSSKIEELQALNEHAHVSMTTEAMEMQLKIVDLENLKVWKKNC